MSIMRNPANLILRSFGRGKQKSKEDKSKITHLLRKNPGYTDKFISFYNTGRSYEDIESLFIKTRDYRPLLRSNNIDILRHNYSSLVKVVDEVIKANEDKKFVDALFSSKSYGLRSKRIELKIIQLKDKGYTLESLRSLLFGRLSHYHSEEELWIDLNSLTIKNDFKFRVNILSFLLGVRRKKVGNYLILDFGRDFWRFTFFLSLRWCIKTRSRFNDYVKDNKRQLIIFDFSRTTSSPLYKVGITIDRNGLISHAHDKVNRGVVDADLQRYQKLILLEYMKNKINYDNLSIRALIDIGEYNMILDRLSRKTVSDSDITLIFSNTNLDIRITSFRFVEIFLQSQRISSLSIKTWKELEGYLDKYCDFDWKDFTKSNINYRLLQDKKHFFRVFLNNKFYSLLTEYKKEIMETDFTFFKLDSKSALDLYNHIVDRESPKLIGQKFIYNISKSMDYDDLKRSVFISKNPGIIKSYNEEYNKLKSSDEKVKKEYRTIMASIFLLNPSMVENYLSEEIIDESIYIFCFKYQKASIYYEDVEVVIRYYDIKRLKKLLSEVSKIPMKNGNFKSNKTKQAVLDWLNHEIKTRGKNVFVSEDQPMPVTTMPINQFKDIPSRRKLQKK